MQGLMLVGLHDPGVVFRLEHRDAAEVCESILTPAAEGDMPVPLEDVASHVMDEAKQMLIGDAF
jgi:hypothetical protein